MADNVNGPLASNQLSKTPKRPRISIKPDENEGVVTPSKRRTKAIEPKTPNRLQESNHQTPRRSARKSIKPTQDYNDIVNKSMRSAIKENKDIAEEKDELQIGQSSVDVRSASSAKRAKKVKRNISHENEQLTTATETIEEVPDIQHENKVTESPNKEKLAKSEYEEKITEFDDEKKVAESDNDQKVSESTDEKKEAQILETEQEEETFCAKDNTYDLQQELEDKTENAPEAEQSCKAIASKMEETKTPQLEDINTTASEFERKIKAPRNSISQKMNVTLEKSETVLPLMAIEAAILEQTAKEKDNDNVEKEDFVSLNKKEVISEKLNFSDLGLKPLEPENEDIATKQETEIEKSKEIVEETIKESSTTHTIDDEEMESLIYCEDDDEEETIDAAATNVNNETFDTSDCFIISPTVNNVPAEPSHEQSKEDHAKSSVVKFSQQIPEIVITNVTLLETPLPCIQTPKRSLTKPTRLPTPYKPKYPNLENAAEDEEEEEHVQTLEDKELLLPALEIEPKDMMLPGIRKRSLSLSIESSEAQNLAAKRAKSKNRVTFFSPANQTAVIEELDELILNTIDKDKFKPKSQTKTAQDCKKI